MNKIKRVEDEHDVLIKSNKATVITSTILFVITLISVVANCIMKNSLNVLDCLFMLILIIGIISMTFIYVRMFTSDEFSKNNK